MFTSMKPLLLPLILLHATAATAADPTPPLDVLLARAGDRAAALEEELAVVTATEEHDQRYLLGRDEKRRRIVSDVVWVPTGDAMVWAFFRDVVSVDGAPVADRTHRLDELFAGGATAAARRRAAEMQEAGARFHLGRRRTVDAPNFALAVLHPRNRTRFRFDRGKRQPRHGADTVSIDFRETASPTLVRTSSGRDVPARGRLWIEPAAGGLVASELRLDVPGLRTEIEVRFGRDERLQAWLPAEMTQAYGERSSFKRTERVEATARYSGFRRAGTSVEIVFPKP
jgi:hypothetical protein